MEIICWRYEAGLVVWVKSFGMWEALFIFAVGGYLRVIVFI